MSVKNQNRRTGWKKSPLVLTTAAVLASLSVGMISFAAPSSWGSYDWDAGARKTAEDIYGRAVSDLEQYGPGAMEQVLTEEEWLDEGPTVDQVTISEQYHEDYKIYEESIGGLFFFYSTVANGGITHETVELDIPDNLTYTMQKDGSAWEWHRGQSISGYGTYVMVLTGVEDLTLPLSEQKEYKAVFRFRIQEKPPAEEGDDALMDGFGSEGYGYYPGGTAPFGVESGYPADEDQPSDLLTDTETESEETAEGEPVDGSDEDPETDAEPEDETGSDGEAAGDGEETGEPEDAEVSAKPVIEVPRTQEYDTSSKRYLVTLENGRQLVSNVPEGYVGGTAVQVTVAEDDVDVTKAYCNDQEIEYVRGNSFMDPGQYQIVVDGRSFSFAVATAVSGMDHYAAPAGMRFTSCSLDGEEVKLASDRYVTMDRDGVYAFVMEGEEGEKLELALTKDTVAPKFTVTIKGGTAEIQYQSEDNASIELVKDGEPVEKFGGYMISTPGKYTLTVTDAAGNATSQSFQLNYQVNGYGIAAVALVIILIAGIAAFVVRTKKSVTVR